MHAHAIPFLKDVSNKPRVLIISAIIALDEISGQLVLYRHLIERDDVELLQLDPRDIEQAAYEESRSLCSFDRLLRTRFHKVAKWLRYWSPRRKLPEAMRKQVDDFSPDMILTVAHGEFFELARVVAKKLSLPLLSIYHDWWPDLAKQHTGAGKLRAKLTEARFRRLYHESDAVLCVSEAMREALGDHANAHIVPPIPAKAVSTLEARPISRNPFTVVYAGNMYGGYGVAIRSLLEKLEAQSRIRLQCYGSYEDWPQSCTDKYEASGVLKGFVKYEELRPALAEASALLVVMSFSVESERFKTVGFPSKLSSYAEHERPIICWAPEETSVIRFAREHNLPEVCTSSDPDEVYNLLVRLADDDARIDSACKSSRRVKAIFDPDRIHERFLDGIKSVLVDK